MPRLYCARFDSVEPSLQLTPGEVVDRRCRDRHHRPDFFRRGAHGTSQCAGRGCTPGARKNGIKYYLFHRLPISDPVIPTSQYRCCQALVAPGCADRWALYQRFEQFHWFERQYQSKHHPFDRPPERYRLDEQERRIEFKIEEGLMTLVGIPTPEINASLPHLLPSGSPARRISP